jgi:hypothetical protein
MEDADAFHNTFYYFLDAVTTLAAEPEVQCERMGDYNVAWELKDDLQAGRYLLGRGFLSEAEEQSISGLTRLLNEVDAQSLPSGTGRDVNLAAMNDLSWVSCRRTAIEVLHTLKKAGERTAAFFRNSDGAA